MGRPSRSDEAATVKVMLSLTPSEARVLDERRGKTSRSAFLRRLLLPKVPEPSLPTVADCRHPVGRRIGKTCMECGKEVGR